MPPNDDPRTWPTLLPPMHPRRRAAAVERLTALTARLERGDLSAQARQALLDERAVLLRALGGAEAAARELAREAEGSRHDKRIS